MSHFTVLVIGQNPEEQLAPFQENNCGDCPEEYLKYQIWDKEGKVHWFDSEEAFRISGIESDGEQGYWENPNRKWDWFQLGGRWTGFFKTKVGITATVGEPGVMTERAEEGRADQLIKAEIDFEHMREEARINAAKAYDFAMTVFGDLPSHASWDELKKLYPEEIEKARTLYWAQPRCAAWNEMQKKDYEKWPFGAFASPDDFMVSRKKYLQMAVDGAIVTHAIIKDGKWYEQGEMGWFGVVHDEKDDASWNRLFGQLIDSLPDDTLLSVYDCHI